MAKRVQKQSKVLPDLQLLIEKAKNGQSHLTSDVLSVYSMSSPWNRHLLNLLCQDCSYLEIGTHKGGTLVAATYKNGAIGVAYDDYRNFGNHHEEALAVVERFGVDAEVWNDDGFKSCDKYDVIFYDGDHGYDDTKKALEHFYPLAKKYLIIDDYQFPEVKRAVDEFSKPMTILLGNKKDDSETWWNGLAIFEK